MCVGALWWSVTAASDAGAQDSLAPPGSSIHYLPKEDWVYRHWIPFDELTLTRLLKIGPQDLESFLYDDHHSLAMIAAQRGLGVGALADQLIAPWRPLTNDVEFALVRDHTVRILTQGHLAQHIFFHVYHGTDARAATPKLFHMSPHAYWHLRLKGVTPLGVAHRGGVSQAHVRAGMIALFQIDHDEGIRLKRSAPSEADRFMTRQIAELSCWLRSPLPVMDPSDPYGKEYLLHPSEHPGHTMTPAQERQDEVNVERGRRRLAPGCWPRPSQWIWQRHGLRSRF